MANQFVARKGLVAKADSNITGSLVISGSNNGLRIKQGKLSLDQPVDISFANGQIIDDNGSGGLRIYTPTYSTDIYSGKSGTLKFFTSGSVERVRLDAAGNMGIGTNSPSTTLHVAGNTAIHTDGTYAGANGDPFTIQDPLPAIRLIDSQATSRVARISAENGALHFESDINSAESNNDIRFSLDGTERLRILNSGNVGIGTATPNRELDVHGSIALQNPSYYSGSYDWMFNQDSSNGRLAISYYGSEKVSITDSGRVGIGVTAPVKELHVSGAARFAQSGYNLDITNGANVVGSNHLVLKGNNSYVRVQSDNNNIYLRTGAGVVVQNASDVEQMRFTQDGKIGIGLTNPSAPLHISQSSTSGVKFSRVNHDDIDLSLEGSNRFVISNTTDGLDLMALMYDTGRVGIGTNAPSAHLEVSGSHATTGRTAKFITTKSTKSNNTYTLEVDSTAHTSNMTAAGAMSVDVNSGRAFTIDGQGDVGIGTSSPGYKLDVSGSGRFSSRLTLNSPDYNQHLNLRRGSYGVDFILTGARLDISPTTSTTEVQFLVNTKVTGSFNAQGVTNLGSAGNDVNIGNASSGYMAFKRTGHNYIAADQSNGTLIFRTGGANNRMIINSSGNVGIGTTSPGALLNIESSTSPVLRISNGGGTSPNPKLEFYRQAGVTANVRYDVANKVFILDNEHTSGIIDFKVANSNKMRITTAGSVGIGTTSPSQKLEVRDGNLVVSSSNSEVVIGTSSGKPRMQSNGNQDLLFSTANQTNVLYLQDANGRVGIGTTSPTKKLTVEGAVSASSGFYGDGSNLTGVTTSDTLATVLGNGNEAQGTAIDMGSGNITQVGELSGETVNVTTASLAYVTASAGLTVDTTLTLKDGTSSDLALNFSSSANTGLYISDYSGGGKQFHIRVNNANYGTFSQAGISSYANVYTGTSGQFRNYAGVWKGTTGQAGGDAQFILNGKTVMHLDEADENVGIGTTTPADSLHISQSNPGIRLSDSTSGREVDFRQIGNQFIIRDVANNASFINANLSNNPVTVESSGIWTFKKDTTIEGDLTVDGIVTAQEFKTEFVSASIIYQSGSTKFGDSSDDLHEFTGSIYVNNAGSSTELFRAQRASTYRFIIDDYARVDHAVNGSVYAQTIRNTSAAASTPLLRLGHSGTGSHITTYGTNEDLIIDPNGTGKVGIGTASPTEKLHLSGSSDLFVEVEGAHSSAVAGIKLTNNYSSTTAQILHDYWGSDYGAGISTHGSHYIAGRSGFANHWFMEEDGTINMVIKDGGRVGIGTDSPEADLHLAGAGVTASGNKYQFIVSDDTAYGINKGGGLIFRGDYNSATSQSNFAAIRSGKANANDGNANAYLAFLYGASGTLTEGMRINYNGNVGIGTTAPSAELHVSGTGFFSGTSADESVVLKLGQVENNSTTPLVTVYTDDVGNDLLEFHTGRYTSVTAFTHASASSSDRINSVAIKGSYTNGGSIEMYGKGGLGGIKTKIATDQSTYFNGGNVGIGTTSPYAETALQVSAEDTSPTLNTTTPTDVTAIFSNSDTAYGTMFATDSSGKGYIQQRRTNAATYYDLLLQPYGGNVGIGTNSPAELLHVSGASSTATIKVESANGGVAELILADNRSTYEAQIAQRSDGRVSITPRDGDYTRGIEILDSGKVGIGTTSPSQKLTVQGNISSSGAVYSDTYAGTTYSANSFLRFNDDQTLQTNMTTLASIARINFIADTNGNDGASARMFTWYANTSDVDTATELMYLNKDGGLVLTGSLEVSTAITASSFKGNGSGLTDVTATIPLNEVLGTGNDGGGNDMDNIGTITATGLNASADVSASNVDVSGNFRVAGTDVLDISGNYTRVFNPDGNVRLYLGNSGDTRTYYQNNHHRFRNAGNTENFGEWNTNGLGVGTTNPGAELDVAASSNGGIRIATNNAFLGATSGGSGADTQLIYWNGNDAYFGRTTTGYTGIVRSYSFRTDGSTKMFITGSSVGIGTSTPTNKLHVDGDVRVSNLLAGNSAASNTPAADIHIKSSGTDAKLRIEDSDGDNLYYDFLVNSGSGFSLKEGSTTRLFVEDSTGNVGIGTTSPSRALDVNGEIQNNGIFRRSGNVVIKSTGTSTLIGPGGDGRISFHSSATMTASDEKMRINEDGTVGIGTTSPNHTLDVSGEVGATSFIETSARKFKENIEPISNALDIVYNIDGVTFNRIGEERREYGFIADEIESTAPELVSYDANGEVHGVHYARTVAILTEAVKELDNKVKAQDLFIKDLVARIEKLENK